MSKERTTPIPGTTEHDVPRDEPVDETEGLFVRTTHAMERGDLLPSLDEKLAELVAAVRKTGKGGTLTLTLALKPEGKSGELVTAAAKVANKLPQEPRSPSLFYTTPGDGLQRDDPRQRNVFDT